MGQVQNDTTYKKTTTTKITLNLLRSQGVTKTVTKVLIGNNPIFTWYFNNFIVMWTLYF